MPLSMTRSVTDRPRAGALLVTALLLAACAGGSGAGGGAGGGGSAGDTAATPCPTSSAVASPAGASAGPGASSPASPHGSACRPGGDGGVTYNENAGGGGGKNVVLVRNQQDGRLLVRGAIQLNRISGPTVEPVNAAVAYGECSDCQTFAVALQINLIGRDAHNVSPQNAAVAANFGCTGCVTVARALQYVYSVDDPTQVPTEVQELLREMEQELRRIDNEPDITLEEAESRIDAIIGRFRELAQSLNDERDEPTESHSPTPSPIPGVTDAEPSASDPGATDPAADPDASASPAASPSASGTAEASPSASPASTP